MRVGMNQTQIAWASRHDWYVATLETGNGVLVAEHSCKAGVNTTQYKEFTDIHKLRAWAGY